VILWYHGFRADARGHAAELERCATAGFLAVGVDAVGHGARRDPHLDARIAASPKGAFPLMLEVVEATVAELPALLDGMADLFPIDRGRISAVGISMGAFLVYRAIVAGPPLRAAVALLGSPEWPNERSPHHDRVAFGPIALLSITAEHDVSVPPEPARRFHAELREMFHAPDRHRHHELRGAGHLTTGTEWDEAMAATVQWLQQMG
jgi:dienelactone hydrolase